MGEFAYTSFGDLKYDALKEIPWIFFGIFVYDWTLCEFFNMDYTFESSLLERGKKVRGVNFNSSGESRVASTFDQQYPAFLLGHSTLDVAVGTFLQGFRTLDKCSRAGTFGNCHKLDKELKNSRTQLPAEIRLDL